MEINLDCMDTTDLTTAAAALRQLARYADNKVCAQLARLEGRIPEALEHEKTCDLIYSELPQDFRW